MIITVMTGVYYVSGDVGLARPTAEITHTKNVGRGT